MKLRRLALILLACCGGLAWTATRPAVARGARLWLNPDTLALAPGDVSTLEIQVENAVQLAGVEIHLTFDPALLEVTDANPSAEGTQIAHGEFLSPDFVAENSVDSTAGTVDYAIACIPLDKAVSGKGVLARITFRALAEGKTRVSIDGALLVDAQEQSAMAETDSSLVVISRPGPSMAVRSLIGLAAAILAAGVIAVMWRTVKAR